MKYYYCQSKWEHAVIEAHNSEDAKEEFISIINAQLEDYKKLTVKDIDACVVKVYFSEERGLTPRALDGLYCQYCGELLSEHLITERGGACEPARQ